MNHRSDYLRCYLMHHHGGAYADIKKPRHEILPHFEALADEHTWLVGYPEPTVWMTGHTPGALGRALKIHYRKLPGQCCFIARPATPFTTEWYAELNRRLDANVAGVARHPGGIFGSGVPWATNPDYPLRWVQLMAEIWHPLALKYHEHVALDDRLRPSFEDYK
jgi:hypothetical protein